MMNTDTILAGRPAGRCYGLDLLKILCMFFVIAFHFSDHGTITLSCSQELSINWCVLAVPRIFGAICNCVFILISGYFLYHKEFSLRNVLKLWMQVLFYSVVLGTVCFIIGLEPFEMQSIIKMIMPFTFNEYWFFSTYIVIYLLFPFLNKLIDVLNKRGHVALIITGLFVFSLLYTIPKVTWMEGANNIPIFIVLYLIGAYLCKYEISIPLKKSLLLSVLLLCIEILSLFGMRFIYHLTGMDSVSYFVWGTGKLLPILTSIFLFLLFKEINLKHTKWIEFVAPSVFGVYLFHIGRLNAYLFGNVFDNSLTFNTNMLLPQMFIAMITIFIAGILMDKLRILMFEKPIFSDCSLNM